MIIKTKDGKSLDTEKDLTAPERHVLQKLFLWETMAASVHEFRNKKDEALLRGWNNSGRIEESPALRSILRDMEKRLLERLEDSLPGRGE